MNIRIVDTHFISRSCGSLTISCLVLDTGDAKTSIELVISLLKFTTKFNRILQMANDDYQSISFEK